MKSMYCPDDGNPLDQLTYICGSCGRSYRPKKRSKVRKPRLRLLVICAPCDQGRHADKKHARCPDKRCHCVCRVVRGEPDVLSALAILWAANRHPGDAAMGRLAIAVALTALGVPKKRVLAGPENPRLS